MVTYVDRLKRGVVISPAGVYKYPLFLDSHRRKCSKYIYHEMTLSFYGLESAAVDFKIIIEGIDEKW